MNVGSYIGRASAALTSNPRATLLERPPISDLRLSLRSRGFAESDFVVSKNSNRFIGGITGRTGTSWLMDALRTALTDDYVVIGEHGSFVLSQLRGAGYEYYQVARRTSTARESYLRYFYQFVTHEAYDRRRVYGKGLRGLRNLVPKRAIKLAFDVLKRDLEDARDLPSCNECFGNFYARLLNLHSLLKAGTLNWISKEPAYGRHVKDLCDLVPDARVVIMARDGRDTVLSMAKHGFCNGDIVQCIDRWQSFTSMTLDSLEHISSDNYLIVSYEQLASNFEDMLSRVLSFYDIDSRERQSGNIHRAKLEHAPISDNSQKWKREFGQKEMTYFEENCGDLMLRLGYKS